MRAKFNAGVINTFVSAISIVFLIIFILDKNFVAVMFSFSF